MSDPVVIVSAARTPLGRFQGELSRSLPETRVARDPRRRSNGPEFSPERIDEVLMGCVLPGGLARRPPGRPPAAPGFRTRRGRRPEQVCGSGMKATMLGHDC